MNSGAGERHCLWLLSLLCFSSAALAEINSTTGENYTGPTTLSLNERDWKKLASSRRVFLDLPLDGEEKLKAVVFRVVAPPEIVWDTIRTFSSYSTWIKNVEHAEVYAESDKSIFVEFEIRHWLIGRINYSVRHVYRYPDTSWGTFSLDQDRDSDLESASGLWRTFAVAGDPQSTDVLYAANLVPKGGKARFFRKQIGKSGLVSATRWLTREAQNSTITK